MELLAGRTALVTGASSGIGAAVARTLGRHGASVAVNYRSNAGAAQAVAADIEQAGSRATTVAGGATDPDRLDAMVADTARQLGDIDVLVVNSIGDITGIADRLRAGVSALDNVEHVLERTNVQLSATLYACRAVVEGMRRAGGGSIVLIGAAGTRRTVGPRGAELLVAKAAQDALGRVLAAELGADGIRVNVVGPGYVPTSANAGPDQMQRAEAIAGTTPLRRVTTVDDVADAVLVLASDLSRATTGGFVAVDGGSTMP